MGHGQVHSTSTIPHLRRKVLLYQLTLMVGQNKLRKVLCLYLKAEVCDNDHLQNMYVFLTEEEDFDFNEDMSKMVWNEDIEYGNWYDGPNSDGTWTREVTVPVPDGVQQNGTWIIHVFIAKDGYPLNPSDSGYKETTIKVEQGKTDAVPGIISYCHPNLTINLVDDWTRGSVPQPVNKCECNG